MKKVRVLLAGAAALALALVGCSAPAAPTGTTPAASGGTEQVTVRMGIQPWIGYAQWHVAEAKGLLEAEGINLELIELKSDSEQSAAFASGRIDVDNIASHTALLLKAQDIGLKIVMVEDNATTADAILARNGITSFAELKGKKVAYEQGATSDLLLHAALKANDMTLADIQPVPMPAADAGAALIAGQVDGAVTYEPYITTALKESQEIATIYDAAKHPGLISDVLVASDAFMAENPEVVRTLVGIWYAAVEEYNTNTPESRRIIAEAVGETAEDLDTAFEGVQYWGEAENGSGFAEYVDTTLPMVLQSATDAGIITSDVDPASAVTDQFLK